MTHSHFNDVANPKMQRVDNYTGVSIARWVVSENDVCYEHKDAHTLSLYLSGGERSYRYDKPEHNGGAGKLCTMPKHHAFNWAIKDTIEFAHIYFPQSTLNWFIGNTFERDVRNINFPSLLYEDDAKLRLLFLKCFAAHNQQDILLFEEKILNVMFHLFDKYLALTGPNKVFSSGLSPFHRKLVRENIYENHTGKLTISRMAAITKLSDFHFAKMFKISFGLTPSEFVTQIRIQEVKKQLKTKKELARISQDLGFSHQSHLTQTFRTKTGFTPAQYRSLIKNS